MTTRTSSEANLTNEEDVLKRKQQRVWNVVPSEFSMLTMNPIRSIVDNIKMPKNKDKKLIPLSLGKLIKLSVSYSNEIYWSIIGDPTVFGNFKCPEVLVESIVRNVRYVYG